MDVSTKQVSCDFILFGTQGDLAQKKLIPALYHLESMSVLSSEVRLIGAARKPLTLAQYQDFISHCLVEQLEAAPEPKVLKRLLKRFKYCNFDFIAVEDYQNLQALCQPEHVQVFYLATPPSVYSDIFKGIYHAQLIRTSSRIVVEKPIGVDLASSQVINDQIAAYFSESQVYRIDHYLGKETVQNLIALRFANSLLASNWDAHVIDHIQITVAEEIGIDGRWNYFDTTGQMRDMIQNHLLQILSLVAMEPPAHLDADSIRDEKVKAIRSLRPMTAQSVLENTVRGQYQAGQIQGEAVPGYQDASDAAEESDTETFVALRAYIDNWRWAGVPFYLRSGKRMPYKSSEIVIYFKEPPHNLYATTSSNPLANKLTIRLQPDEGMDIEIMNTATGLDMQPQLHATKLDLSFRETFKVDRTPDAYERLLLAVMRGDQSLFVRRDEIEAAWTWVDGILNAWQLVKEPPKPYPAGTWGPIASMMLMTQDGRSWGES